MTGPVPDPVEHQPGRVPRLAARVDGVRRLARRRPRLTVVVAVVVVALVVVGARVWSAREPGGPGWAHSPRSAVQGYLTAVADGRAADALAYLSSPPEDRTFLTDAVLAQSRDLAPMVGIVVGDVFDDYSRDKECRGHSCTVQAEYRMGDQKTRVELEVSQDGGYWFVDRQPSSVDLVAYDDRDAIGRYQVSVLVNGTPLPLSAQEAVLFPGRYRVTSNHPLVAIDTTFTVEPTETEDRGRDPHVQLQPSLTADGKTRITQAAQDQLDTCLTQTSFATECGFLDIDDSWFDGPADPTTISWTLVGDATMPAPDGQLDGAYGVYASRGRLTVDVPITIQPRCTWANLAGQALEWEPWMVPTYYVADITDPESITITFVYA